MNESTTRPVRLAFPIGCLVLYWLVTAVAGAFDKLYFYTFLIQLGSSVLFALAFFGWWLFNRGLARREKLLGIGAIIGLAFVTGFLLHPSMNPFMLFRLGIPIVAAWTIFWLWRGNRLCASWGVGAVLVWSAFLLARNDGFDSQLNSSLDWRWKPSSEERFLAGLKEVKAKAAIPMQAAASHEWVEFRGPNRDGVFTGTSLATNWTASPPKLVWKRPVGPAWSSMIVVGARLYTQEQRGPREAVVCYDANDGNEIWAHLDDARFDESLSGIGPRATPTLEKGRLYTLGATGLLNCLDAESGKKIWQRNAAADADAKPMQWGFSSSPLVKDRKVFVFAGGPKGMLAYNADSGEIAWTAPVGESSYSSAQATVVDGAPLILMLHDSGLSGFEPATGKKLWDVGEVFKGGPRSCQPRLISTNEIIVGALIGSGTTSLKLERNGGNWSITTNWVSRDMKPEFPDFVVHNNFAYGFDVGIFCCVNLADGKRAWKDGRYGRGQVVLLADQGLLLVSSEKGELALLAIDPSAHRELGKFKALEGKTWNGPVARGDLVFHRNAQEMACYRISADLKAVAAR